jgi:hypothetical protein
MTEAGVPMKGRPFVEEQIIKILKEADDSKPIVGTFVLSCARLAHFMYGRIDANILSIVST